MLLWCTLRKFAEIPDLALFPLARPVATYTPDLPPDHPFLQAVQEDDDSESTDQAAVQAAAIGTEVKNEVDDEDDYDDDDEYEEDEDSGEDRK